ncbi:MAG: rhomboid family intramembrane serine protease, partial [Planctomycetota bacterium]
MFIPIRADATVYYRAWATFVIVAANLVLFFLYNPANHVELLVLEFGTLKPWQWITGTFTHADILHVGVNMLFLFWFGQIVEGLIGTFRFLGIYLGMAAAAGLVTQILMLGADEGGAIGASGVIYGLMVIAMVLTPTTRVSVLWWFYSASRVIEMPIRTLAATYLALNLIVAALFGFGM